MTTLAARALAVGYGRRAVLHGIDAELVPGQLSCVLGPNGSGKSTLLRTLAGMRAPLEGRVELDGRDIASLTPAERARLVSVVLTEKIDVGAMTVWDLVALGRHPYTGWAGRLRPADQAAVAQALAAAGADDLADRELGELSDGERQRVVVARALAQEPRVLLLDEPTAYLDVSRRAEVAVLVRDLARDGRAVLFSTHELELALGVADRVWLLERGGTVRVGAPEDLVLDGSFARAFGGDGDGRAGVTFDAATGRFVQRRRGAQATARVRGTGLPATWTARALERRGYAVIDDDGPADLEVAVVDNGRMRWRVGDREFSSLGDLAEWLP